MAARTYTSVEKVVSLFVNPDNRFILVVIYCAGMALFTMVMGSAFVPFPVMTAGISLHFLIQGQHAADVFHRLSLNKGPAHELDA